MAKFDLISTGNTNIQTTFRYEVHFPSSSQLGIEESIAAYNTSSQLPSASGEPIVWYLPMGMQNHQAGRRTVKPIPLEFVVPSSSIGNAYNMLEKWCTSTYDLNTGTNKGKGNYAVDGIQIKLKGEDGVTKHTFTLKRAFPTDVEYGTVNSEGNELLKVSMTLIYDRYEYDNK
jgi:hypothetical protein